MAAGGVSLRRLLLAAIMLSLAICLQEVTAKSGGGDSDGGKTGEVGKDGEGSASGGGDQAGEDGDGGEDGKDGKSDKDGKGVKDGKPNSKATRTSEGGQSSGEDGEGQNSGEDGENGQPKEEDAPSTENSEIVHDTEKLNEMESGNSTFSKLACPKECPEWKLEVLALCGNELKGFDNLCYFFQHKCNNPTAGCHFYCCLYPGTDVATASKFDCDDMCRF